MERYSAQGAIQPGLKILARFDQTGLGFSAQAELHPVLKKSHVIFACNFIFGVETNISAEAEVCHVNATKFQPG